MARILLAAAIIVSSCVLAGCGGPNLGASQMLPNVASGPPGSNGEIDPGNIVETDLVEQVAVSRRAYHVGLERLLEYYTKTGDHVKLTWARRELAGFQSMPRYDYIIEASIAGPDLRAMASIPEADYIYREAVQVEKSAGPVGILRDKDMLRLALAKYNQVIGRHPSSDKIDDCAYRAAGIYKHFKDYDLAVLYYQRVYQWDPQTAYPARFQEAYILDKDLHRRAEALEAWQRALKSIKRAGEHGNWVEYARQRVQSLTKVEEEGK